jgi:hypothetical protein
MSVKTQKEWLTVYFTATQLGTKPQTIELNFNYKNNKYTIMNERHDTVDFKGDTIFESKLKLKAIAECIKFLENEIKNNKLK